MVLRLISFARAVEVSIIRGWGEDDGPSHLLVTIPAHRARVGQRERISHVGADRVGRDIGVLGGRRQVLALAVVERTAHLRDWWRERGAHVVLLLLLLERIQRPHTGEGEGAAAAHRAITVWFTNLLLIVGRRIAVLRARQRRRWVRGRARITSSLLARLAGRRRLLLLLLLAWLLLLLARLLLVLRVRHRWRRGSGTVQVGGQVRAVPVAVAVRHGDGGSARGDARWAAEEQRRRTKKR